MYAPEHKKPSEHHQEISHNRSFSADTQIHVMKAPPEPGVVARPISLSGYPDMTPPPPLSLQPRHTPRNSIVDIPAPLTPVGSFIGLDSFQSIEENDERGDDEEVL